MLSILRALLFPIALKISKACWISMCCLACVCHQVDLHLPYTMCLFHVGYPPAVCNVSPTCWISTCSLQCVAYLLDLLQVRAKFLSMSDFHLQFMLYESYKLNFHFTSSVCLFLVAWHLPFTMDLLLVGFPPAFCDVSTTC